MWGVLGQGAMIPEVGHYYWIRLYRDDAAWQIARWDESGQSMTGEHVWFIFAEPEFADLEYYETEVNEVGPEIVPPQPRLVLDGPPYFEDDQECGYCQRPVGSPHEKWCRQ